MIKCWLGGFHTGLSKLVGFKRLTEKCKKFPDDENIMSDNSHEYPKFSWHVMIIISVGGIKLVRAQKNLFVLPAPLCMHFRIPMPERRQ